MDRGSIHSQQAIPVVTSTSISSSTWANNTLTDIASALTDSVAADGQTPMTGQLDLNS